ncbi:MAG: glycerate kinase [Rhodospirillaceae bacterium]|nr:glycerate kinase [Rhodospirillaceae bacterium]
MVDPILYALFEAAVNKASPSASLAGFLPKPPVGRTVVVGAGKAAASMAQAVEAAWQAEGRGDLSGLVVTRYGHGAPTKSIEVVEAAHPVPDDAGEAVARRILDLVSALSADDLVLCLISGGGSALMALPAGGLSLSDKRDVNSKLLKSGAAIDEMNTVRKHLSAIKGGRLAAAAYPARVVSLAISDVPGDDPSVIASGPAVGDPTTFADAQSVLDKYAITPPPAVTAHLRQASDETPKPDDPRVTGAEVKLIATPLASLEAAVEAAQGAGYEPRLLGDDIEGEARAVGLEHAEMALKIASEEPGAKIALISGGETTVTVTGKGRGGRNVEYLLGLTLGLEGHAGICAIACDTDGIDGTEDNAGAITRPDSLARARELGLDGAALLADNNAYAFFEALGDLVVTGPTRTNVNDFRCILIE